VTLDAENKEMPRASALTERIAGKGSAAWAIADAAADAIDNGADGVISLCLGDTTFDTPAPAVVRAVDALRSGDTHYTPVPGIPALRRAVAADQASSDGGAWASSQTVIFAGAQNALFAAMQCVAGAGDDVIVLEPWYATYEACVRASGAGLIGLNVSEAKDDRITADLLAQAVTPNTRAILLNGPNNPGGYVFSRAELEAVADCAKDHDLWVVSDEVYRTAVFDQDWVSITHLPGMAARTIVVNSLSKSHAMTGWRLGWTLSPEPMAGHLENLAQCMLFGSPPFVQEAGAVALSAECDADKVRFAAELKERRTLLADALQDCPGLSFQLPQGGMFLFADVAATGLSGQGFAERLYTEEKTAIVPGFAFGPNMTNFIRISFSGHPDHLSEGAARIRAFATRLMAAQEPSQQKVSQ
jgi:aspartate/methionine/tyrosine aminotransferase